MASLTTVTNHFGTEDTALTYSFTVLKSRANETSDVTAFRITNLGDVGGSWTDSKGGIYTASANKGFVLYQAVAGVAAVEYALVYTSTGLNLYSYTAGAYSLAKSTGASLVWLPPADAYGTLTAFSVTGVSLSTTSFNQLTTNDVAVKVAVANVNDLPQYQSAQIIGLSTGPLGAGGVPAQGQTLVASAANVTDADGKGVVSWQWFSNGVAITGATGNSLTLTQALVDKKISVVGTYTDGGGTVETIVSDQTKAVANVNDAPTGVVTITGNAVQGYELVASNTLADIDGLGPINYVWKADGVEFAAGTNKVTLTQAQVGKQITAVAAYTDGYLTTEQVSSAASVRVANVNDAGVVLIKQYTNANDGTFEDVPVVAVEKSLTAVVSDDDGLSVNGVPVTIKYQWQQATEATTATGWLDIAGATSPNFTIQNAQYGKYLRVVVSYTDALGSTSTLVSGVDTATSSVTSKVVSNNINPPVFTQAGDLSVSENTVAVTTVLTTDADKPKSGPAYSIVEGLDGGFFSINATTGALSFKQAPDFETPKSAAGTNTYQVQVQADDGLNVSSKLFAIQVTNVNETPTVQPVTFSTDDKALTQTVNLFSGTTDPDVGTVLTALGRTTQDFAASDLTITVGGVTKAVPGGVKVRLGSQGNMEIDTSKFNFLQQGETAVVTLKYRVTDSTSDQPGPFVLDETATVNIAGTNDAPVVINHSVDKGQNDGIVAFNLLDGASDAEGVALSVINPVALVGGQPLPVGAMVFNTVAGTATLDTSKFSFLADGETRKITVQYAISDGVLSTPSTYEIIMAGANDAPLITEGSVINLPTKSELGTPGELSITSSSTLHFTDLDLTNTHTVAVFSSDGFSNLGNLTQVLTDSVNTGAGQVTLNYSVPAAQLEYLALGETRTESFLVSVTDNFNQVQTATVRVTIQGTNDAPVVGVVQTPTPTPVVEAVSDVVALTATGQLSVLDADLHDKVSFTVDSVSVDGTFPGKGGFTTEQLASFKSMLTMTTGQLAAEPTSADTVTWNFASGGSGVGAFSFLGQDETLVLNYVVKATDSTSAQTATTVSVTLKGTNDLPVFHVAPALIQNNGSYLVSYAESVVGEKASDRPIWLGDSVLGSGDLATDPDSTDSVQYSISGTDAGQFQINATTGVITFTPNYYNAETDSVVYLSGPDYEAPTDANLDNTYVLTVTATDSKLGATSKQLSVNVGNIDEIPTIAPTAPTVQEGRLSFVLGQQFLPATDDVSTSSQLKYVIDSASDLPQFGYLTYVGTKITPENYSTINIVQSQVVAGKLYYTNYGDGMGVPAGDAFSFSLVDAGGHATGKITLPINITPVGLSLDAADDSGRADGDQITNLTSALTLRGTRDASTRVQIFEYVDSNGDGVLQSTEKLNSSLITTVDASASTSFSKDISLSEGVHFIYTKELASASSQVLTNSSQPLKIVVDKTAPLATSIPDLAADSDSNVTTDNITYVVTPEIKGTGEAGAMVSLFNDANGNGVLNDGELIANAIPVNESGNWSYTTNTLAQGTYAIRAVQTDVAGNISPSSATLTLKIDTQVEAPADLTAVGVNMASILGNAVAQVNAAKQSGFTLSGLGEAGATVTLSFDSATTLSSSASNTVTVGNDGHWSIAISAADIVSFSSGLETVTAIQKDIAGNISSVSQPLKLWVDTVLPVVDSISITSSNVDAGLAKRGDTLTINFSAHDVTSPLQVPVVTMAGRTAAVSLISSSDSNRVANFVATYVLDGTESLGAANISIQYADQAGNSTAVTTTTNGSSVNIIPEVLSVSAAVTAFAGKNTLLQKFQLSDTATSLLSNLNSSDYATLSLVDRALAVEATTSDSLSNLSQVALHRTALGNLALAGITDQIGNLSNVDGVLSAQAVALLPIVKSSGTVTINGDVNLAQLTAIDGATVASLAYGVVKDSASALAANAVLGTGRYVAGDHAIVATTDATVDELNAIDAATTGVITANVSDTASNLQALTGTENNYTVTVTSGADVASLNAIRGKTTGLIHATINASAQELVGLNGTNNDYTVTVNGAVTVGQLNTIDLATTGVITALVGDTADNLLSLTGTGNNYTVNVSSGASVSKLNAIDAKTIGVVSATLTATAADLTTLTGTNNNYALTVSGDATVAQLTTIDAATTGLMVYSSVKDSAANLLVDAAKNSGHGLYVSESHAVEVTDAAGVTVSQLNSIRAATTGAIKANIISTAGSLVGLTASANNNYTVTVSDDASLSQLVTIDQATTGALSYGKVKDVAASLAADASSNAGAGLYVSGSHAVQVTDAATVTQLNTIDLATSGVVTATISGYAADLVNLRPSGNNNYTITVSGTATLSQLADIQRSTSGVITASVADTAENLVGLTGVNQYALTVSNSASVAQLTTIASKTTGTLTYGTVRDTAAALASAASNGLFVKGSHPVEVTDTPTVAQLNSIDSATDGTIKATISGTAGALAALNGSNNDYTITVTGVSTIDQLSKIDAATSNSFTFGAISDAGSNLDADAQQNEGKGMYLPLANSVTVTSGATVDYLNSVLSVIKPNVNVVASVSSTASDLVRLSGTDMDYTINVTSGATVQLLNQIDAITRGVVTAQVSSTAEDLVGLTGVNDYAITVSNPATLGQLASIKSHTNGSLTYGAVRDVVSNLTADAALNAGKGNYVTGNHAIQVQDSASVSDLNILDAVTTGVISASVSDTAEQLSGLTGTNNRYTVNVTGGATVSLLNQIDAKTTGVITASINAAASDLVGLTSTTNNYAVTVNTVATVDQLTKIDAATVGALNYSTVRDTAINLAADAIKNGNTGLYVSGSHAVEVTDVATDVTVSRLNVIDAATTGVITASISDLSANLENLTEGNNLYTVGVTDAATIAQLRKIDAATAGVMSYGVIQDNKASLLNDLGMTGDATRYVTGDHVVVVTDSSVASDVNKIAAATSGVVTATVTGAAASVLKANLVNAVETDKLTLTVLAEASGATQAADLKALDGKTSLVIHAATVFDVVQGQTTPPDEANAVVSVSGSIGELKYVYVDATKTQYSGLGNESIIVTDQAADAADLLAIGASVSQQVTVNALSISGTGINLANLYVTVATDATKYLNLGDETIAVTGVASATVVNAVANKTVGKVTATVAGAAGSVLVSALADTNGVDELTLTVLAEASGATQAADLRALDDKTSLVIHAATVFDVVQGQTTPAPEANAVVNVSGSIGDLRYVYVDATKTQYSGLGNEAITVTDEAVDAADLLSIGASVNQQVTVNALSISGSMANLVSMYATVGTLSPKYLNLGNESVSVSGTTSVASLNSVDAKTTGVIEASVTSTAADLITLTGIDNNYTVTITDDASIANLTYIDNATTGEIKYSVVKDTAINLEADALTHAGAGTYLTTSKNVTVTDQATVQQLREIDSAAGNVKLFGICDAVENLFDLSQANDSTLYSDVTTYLSGTDQHSVTVLGPVTLAQISALKQAVAGNANSSVVFTDVSDTAANLLAAKAASNTALNQPGVVVHVTDIPVLTDETGITAIQKAQALYTMDSNASYIIQTTRANINNNLDKAYVVAALDYVYTDTANVPDLLAYSFSAAQGQLVDALTGSNYGNAGSDLTVDFSGNHSLYVGGVSAASLQVRQTATFAANVVSGETALYANGKYLHLQNLVSALDGNAVLFDDGSVLKTNFDNPGNSADGVKATLNGSNLAGVGDLLIAGNTGDTLNGLAGNDKLLGGTGKDLLYGGAGNDTLIGGAGSDYLSGGTGSNSYYFENKANWGADSVQGFVAGTAAPHDYFVIGDSSNGTGTLQTVSLIAKKVFIDVDANGMFNSGDTLLATLSASGADTLVTFSAGGGTSARLLNVGVSTLVADDFRYMSAITSLTGTAAAENLMGSPGADMIVSGTGADTLTGGAGADVFAFTSPDQSSGTSGVDTITDFTSGVDKIRISLNGQNIDCSQLTRVNGSPWLFYESGAVKVIYDVWSGMDPHYLYVYTNQSTSGGDWTNSYTIQVGRYNGYPNEVNSVVASDLQFAITGTTGNDLLKGGAGADSIAGGDGNDTITGGLGADTVSGGIGQNTYVYGSNLDSYIASTTDVASGFDFVRVISGDKFNFGTPVTAVESAGAATKFLVPEPLTNSGTDLMALLDKYFNANAKTGVAAALFETTASLKDYLVVDLNGDQHITAADQVVQLSGSISSIQLNTNGHVIIG